MLFVASLGFATVRPIHVAFPHTQSDGTTIKAYLHGDGFEAYFTTLDGKVLVRSASHDLCYAFMKDGKLVSSGIIAHEASNRSASELSFLAANPLDPNSKEVLQQAVNLDKEKLQGRMMRGLDASTDDGLGKYKQSSNGDVPSLGSFPIPVIMAQFTNRSFLATTTSDALERVLNEQGYHDGQAVGSVKDYFAAQSDSLFTPSFPIVATVTVDHPYSYYGGDVTYGSNTYHDYKLTELFSDAVAKAVEQGVDFSQYYVDGRVPLVAIIYAGPGQATGGDDNTIWPQFRTLTYSGRFGSEYTTAGGYKFGSTFFGNELYGTSSSTTLMGIGVFVHEFGHALGLPDFYVTDYSYSGDSPFGYWSVMDEGEYNADSYAPIGYNAYEKSYMGWLDMKVLSGAMKNELKPGEAVVVRNPSSSTENFILENRHPDTWYPRSMGSGLLMMRIAYNNLSWERNTLNNDQAYKRAMVVTADGAKLVGTGSQSNLFGNGVINIPTFNLYDGSTLSTSPVYRIEKHSDGTVTFSYLDRKLNNAKKGDVEYYKVTDLNDLQNSDSIIFVNESDSVSLGTESDGTVRFGADLYLEDGVAYATSDVVPLVVVTTADRKLWAFRYSTTTYLASLGGSRLGFANPSTASTGLRAVLTMSDGNIHVQFQSSSKPYLVYNADDYAFSCSTTSDNNVQIYSRRKPVANGISSVKTSVRSADDAIYTITGQKIDRNDMRPGIYIIGGKKVVVK